MTVCPPTNLTTSTKIITCDVGVVVVQAAVAVVVRRRYVSKRHLRGHNYAGDLSVNWQLIVSSTSSASPIFKYTFSCYRGPASASVKAQGVLLSPTDTTAARHNGSCCAA